MYHFRALAFAALLSVADAARMKEVHDRFQDPEEKVATETVCEDDAIWGQIMASPDVGSIRAIPWKEISDSIENYLDNEGLITSNLQSEIQKFRRKSAKNKQLRFPKC